MRRGARRGLLSGKSGTIIKIGIIAVVLIALVVILSSRRGSNGALDLSKVKKRGTLLVGVRYADELENDAVYDVEQDLAKAMAKEIFGDEKESSKQLTLIEMNQSFMDRHFSDSTIDVAIMLCPRGLYGSKYAYSESYYDDDCIVAIKKDGETDDSIAGKRIGVIANSICKKRINDYLESKKLTATVVEYPTYEIMLNDLTLSAIKYAVMPGVYYSNYQRKYRLAEHSLSLPKIEYAVACSIEDSDLITVANRAINNK